MDLAPPLRQRDVPYMDDHFGFSRCLPFVALLTVVAKRRAELSASDLKFIGDTNRGNAFRLRTFDWLIDAGRLETDLDLAPT
jgi:hypothetical protein